MHVSIDGATLDVPVAQTLGELLDGVAPLLDPGRLVTHVEVDGVPADGTDRPALARRRLLGAETVTIGTEAPQDFVSARRRAIPKYLARIGDLIQLAAHGFTTGQEADANRVLAAVSRELVLVLELDQRLALLDSTPATCDAVAETVRRIGARLTEAEQQGRWAEVATLLSEELLPSVRASEGAPR